MSKPLQWPDYCRRETLAKRLNLPASAIDQFVKRGLLPQPIKIGEAVLWRWESVDTFLQSQQTETLIQDFCDPYIAGALQSREAASSR